MKGEESMKWEKIEKTVNSFGTTITYAAQGTGRQLLVCWKSIEGNRRRSDMKLKDVRRNL